MTPVRVDLGYTPRRQFVSFHRRTKRWACVVSHVRAGKTVACLMDLVDAALRCKLSEPRFAYVAPYYAQAKDIAWTYLKLHPFPAPSQMRPRCAWTSPTADRYVSTAPTTTTACAVSTLMVSYSMSQPISIQQRGPRSSDLGCQTVVDGGRSLARPRAGTSFSASARKRAPATTGF